MPRVTIDGDRDRGAGRHDRAAGRAQPRARGSALLLPPGLLDRRQLPDVPGRGREGAQADDLLRRRWLPTAWSCTPATNGFVEAQASVMEFLLINHPLDCPICDQAGECRLQEYAVDPRHRGQSPRRRQGDRRARRSISAATSRSIRNAASSAAAASVSATRSPEPASWISFSAATGPRSGLYPGKRLDNPYSGNTADICPVGALTVKEFRFATRVWYLKNTPSVCAGCAKGCNVMVAVGRKQELMTSPGQLDDGIKRIVPRVNEGGQRALDLRRGAPVLSALEAAERLPARPGRRSNELDWDAAIARAASQTSAPPPPAGRLGVIASPRATNETLYALNKVDRRRVGGANAGRSQQIHRGRRRRPVDPRRQGRQLARSQQA